MKYLWIGHISMSIYKITSNLKTEISAPTTMQTVLLNHSSVWVCASVWIRPRDKNPDSSFSSTFIKYTIERSTFPRGKRIHTNHLIVCVFVGGTSNKKFVRSYSRFRTCTFYVSNDQHGQPTVRSHTFLHTRSLASHTGHQRQTGPAHHIHQGHRTNKRKSPMFDAHPTSGRAVRACVFSALEFGRKLI